MMHVYSGMDGALVYGTNWMWLYWILIVALGSVIFSVIFWWVHNLIANNRRK